MADLTNGYNEELSRADVNTSAENADAADAADFSVAENAVESEVQNVAEERTTEEQTEAINAAEKSPTAPPRAEKNPFDRDGFHGEVVTEAVVHEHKLPKSSEKSATIEAAEAIVAEGEMTDSEYIAGLKPVIHYHLSDFDGPLDLLLELIKDAKIRIEDIFVSDVTRQYVERKKSSTSSMRESLLRLPRNSSISNPCARSLRTTRTRSITTTPKCSVPHSSTKSKSTR